MLPRILPLAVLLPLVLLPDLAIAQVPPPPPPPPELPQATPAPAAPVDADRRAAEMEQKLRALEESSADMKRQIQALHDQQSLQGELLEPPKEPPPPPPPAEPSAPGATSVLGLQLRFHGALTLRYDYWHNSDLTDQLTANWVNNGFRQRIRFGVEFADPKTALVIGGLRLSTGESPNPTVPFIALGDSFRASSFGLDQAWIAVRPLNDRSRVSLYLGRMPNQTWRGTAGTLRTEMIWDDDINPAGIALKVKLLDLPQSLDFKLENLIAYYQLQETQDQRFVGLTGTTGLFQEQLKIATKYATGAFAFYDWENLNNGLSSPGIATGSVSVQQPSNASLLQAGLNNGNGRFAYGPMNAIGFVKDHFRVINPTLEVHVPFKAEKCGSPDIYVLGDYAYNFSAKKNERWGYGLSLGTRIGSYEPSAKINPLNAWVTYRRVKSDVTVAAISDSDLGAGTDMMGVEVGASYRITKHLMPAVSYFDYYGFPLLSNHAQRVFLDMTGEF